jgi:hypothetical protein
MVPAVTPSPDLAPAFSALDACETALRQLEAKCCDPGRGPRMTELAITISDARRGVERAAGDPAEAARALALLEDAGAQVGRLQVGCCAPGRLPLYATILVGLTTVQLTVNRALDRAH